MKIKIYGCRGSTPFSRKSEYGGNTSCMTIEYGDSLMILDAGSGIMQLDAELREKYPSYPHDLPFRANILIGHLHLDHIIGMTGFAPIWTKGTRTRIFTNARGEKPLEEQIFGSFMPPYWPVRMADISQAECITITDTFDADGLTVVPFLAVHPDHTLCFYITDGKKSIVHLLDYEITEAGAPEDLLKWCNNADLVIFDSAYSQADYALKRGWGHSTVQEGIKLANQTGCKKVLYAHYGQEYSDADLDKWHDLIPEGDERFIFAKEGMEIEI